MIRRLAMIAVISFCLPAYVQAQLTLNSIGGGPFGSNLSIGASAFALNIENPTGGTAQQPVGHGGAHTTTGVNNGAYGNSLSWLAGTANSFVGINFGASTVNIAQVAWGRDNNNVLADRSIGDYTLQYTTVPNPDNTTPGGSWTTLGTVTYEFTGVVGSPVSNSLRHVWTFPTVAATGIRLITSNATTGIDELEATSAIASPPLTLLTTGGTFLPGNLSLAGTEFGKDELSAFNHFIAEVNDGVYGNASSWIGNSADSFVGVALAASTTIDRLAFGRNNSGAGEQDRDTGMYLIQYTTVASPNAATPDGSWTNLGAVYYDPADANAHLRHLYQFAPVTATGIRIFAQGNGLGSGRAIDEIEIYAVIPEPSSLAMLLFGAIGLFLFRRR